MNKHAEPHIIEIPKISDPRGNLSFIQYPGVCPFPIKRTFYLYDVPADSERGGHAHYESRELILALAGSFDVVLSDGVTAKRWHLDRPYRALYVPTGLWRTIDNFSGGAVCMVLTSTVYSESDYIRNYDQFLEYRRQIGEQEPSAATD